MKICHTFFLYLVLSFFISRGYAAEFCPPHETIVTIDNRVVPERLKYDYSKSVPEIMSLAGAKGESGHVLGFFTTSINTKSKIKTITGKNFCIKKVEAHIVTDFDPTIYVAREFLEGTDAYNYVSWHENEHARIVIYNNKRYLPYLEQEMVRYIDGLKEYVPSDINEHKQHYRMFVEKINSAVTKNVKDLNYMISRTNRDFDHKEHKHDPWLNREYDKVREE